MKQLAIRVDQADPLECNYSQRECSIEPDACVKILNENTNLKFTLKRLALEPTQKNLTFAFGS
jgi:hypothetical protein